MIKTAAALLLALTLNVHAEQVLPLKTFFALMSGNAAAAQTSLDRIRTDWRNEYAAMLLEMAGFIPERATQSGVLALLERASGRRFGGDLDQWY